MKSSAKFVKSEYCSYCERKLKYLFAVKDWNQHVCSSSITGIT